MFNIKGALFKKKIKSIGLKLIRWGTKLTTIISLKTKLDIYYTHVLEYLLFLTTKFINNQHLT